jgi:predicted nucleotidyltransferase component of viral defense system
MYYVTMSILATVELFHLIFLRHFGERVGKDLYAVKGGCNLRFFFQSIRYSEDLDIDAHTISPETLRSNVRKIISGRTFIANLRAREIEIKHLSESKQTDTTQRWKIILEDVTVGREVPTKIEFSRRDFNRETVFEAVEGEMIARYKLYPIFVSHYSKNSALEQKILALIKRSITQARDVFDIDLLLNGGAQVSNTLCSREELENAKLNLLSLDFDSFKGQVVAYLEPNYQQIYDHRDSWEQIVARVMAFLEKIS